MIGNSDGIALRMVHFFPEPSASFFECYIRKKAEKLEYRSKYPKKNMNLYRFGDKRYNKYIKHSEKLSEMHSCDAGHTETEASKRIII